MIGTARQLVGARKLIKPANIAQVFVSPRKRAQQTLQLLFESYNDDEGSHLDNLNVTVTEDLVEWNYGIYEGLLASEIRAGRKGRGLDEDRDWEIWRDGCEEGEYALAFMLFIYLVLTCLTDRQSR